jgi:hypothetical protein
MPDDTKKKLAAEYRRHATQCAEVAQRMSLRADREFMATMAEKWLLLAEKAERDTDPDYRLPD